MRLRAAVFGATLLAGFAASCGLANDMTSAGDIRVVGPGDQLADASSQGITSTCKDIIQQCQWQVSACKGDPSCARWYNDFQGCMGDLELCLRNGYDAKIPNDTQYNELSRCLMKHSYNGGCQKPPPASVEDASPPREAAPPSDARVRGEAAPSEDAPGGGGGPCDGCNSYDYDASMLAFPPDSDTVRSVPEPPCVACLKKNCLSSCSALSDGAACDGFIVDTLEACMSDQDGGDALVGASFYQCLATQALAAESAQGDSPFQAFVNSGAMQCAYESCEQDCVPPDLITCADCEKTNCSEEFSLFLHDPWAQIYFLCSRAQSADTSVCATAEANGGGDVYGTLVSCRSQWCAGTCS